MGDVFVSKDIWRKLAEQLHAVRENASEVHSFIVRNGNKKWEV